MPEIFTKQNYEEFYIVGDFYKDIDPSDSIVLGSSSVAAEDKDEADVTATVLTAATLAVVDSSVAGADNCLTVWVKAGSETASNYKITFKAECVSGMKLELDIVMKIKEE